MNPEKRLYRSDDTVIAGVCGGIAEYFDFDPTLVRILTVFLVLAGVGVPILVYIIAMVLMPKRTDEFPTYIDVQPTNAQYNTQAHNAYGATYAAPPGGAYGANNPQAYHAAPPGNAYATYNSQAWCSTPPGSAYTTCNPQAYDVIPPDGPDVAAQKSHRALRAGIFVGVLLVCLGLLALVETFLGISVWRFWPIIIIFLGLVVLCTPSDKGWSLSRAGHGVALIAIGFSLLLWTLSVVTLSAFWQTFVYLWPVLIIVVGLAIIGSATKKAAFKLFGSLLFSIALLIGMWNFSQFDDRGLDINLPGGRIFSITIPAPNLFPSGGVFILNDTTFISDFIPD